LLRFSVAGEKESSRGAPSRFPPALIVEIEREGESSSTRNLYRDALRAIARPAEKGAVEWLLERHFRTLGVVPSSFSAASAPCQRIRIAAPFASEAVRQLALASNLHFAGRRVTFDPFTLLSFQMFCRGSETAAKLEGRLLSGQKEWSLSEAEAILPGDPPLLLLGGVLYAVEMGEDLPGSGWNWLKRLFPSGITLSARELENLRDAECSRVVWQLEGAAAPVKALPLPILRLTDRTGAFANLLMRYEGKGEFSFNEPLSAKQRDLSTEKGWEKDLLETGFQKKIVGASHYYCPMDQVAKSLSFLLELGWTIQDRSGKTVVRQSSCEIEPSYQEQQIELVGRLTFGEHETDLGRVVGAFTRREQFVDLSPTQVGWIDREALEQQLPDLQELQLVGGKVCLPRNRIGLFLPGGGPEGGETSRVSCHERTSQIEKLLASRRSGAVESPLSPERQILPHSSFRGELFPYQQEGLAWLTFLQETGFSGLLADEMGLGKTVQLIALLSRLFAEKPGALVLIVVPTSLLFHWKAELMKFLPGASVCLHSGSTRAAALPASGCLITSYALLRIDTELLLSPIWDVVLLDEAQVIKNPEALVAKSAYALKAKMKLAMTGTPVENRPDDLWSIFHFLMPDLLGERTAFRAQVEGSQLDGRLMQRIRRKIAPFLMRRKKSEVGIELPPKQQQLIWVQMEEEQRSFYETWLKKSRQGLVQKIARDGAASHRMEILEAILRLRQICCHPELLAVEEAPSTSAKLEMLVEDLRTIHEEGRKALVYSQFAQMLQKIAKEVDKEGWNYVYLDGSSSNREELVRAFQEDQEVSFFLITLKAGGVGLNLTAADYVCLFDPWWNEAVEQQAIDRAHRHGRKEAVIARKYIVAESIEEKILKLKAEKSSLSDSLLDGTGGDWLALSDDDWAWLFT